MKKVIRLTERDLTRLVKKTIMEMDRFKNYAEGPFSIGNADYEKNWETVNRELKQLSDSRKFHVPPYNPSSGRGWNKETLRSWVEENYGVELPDDLEMRPGIISNWLENNEYERLTESDLVRIVKKVIKENEDEGDGRLYNDISIEDYISAKRESEGDEIEKIRILIKKLYPEVQDNILVRITQDIDEDEIIQDLNNEIGELMDKFHREGISWTEQRPYVNELERNYFKKYISNFLKNTRLF